MIDVHIKNIDFGEACDYLELRAFCINQIFDLPV